MLVVRVDPDAMSVEFVEAGVELADMDLGGNAPGDDSGASPTDFPDRACIQAAYEAPVGSWIRSPSPTYPSIRTRTDSDARG